VLPTSFSIGTPENVARLASNNSQPGKPSLPASNAC